MQLFNNNAYSTLAAGITNLATSLSVASGQGARFPAVTAPDFFMLTLQDASNNIEIVKVTARTAGSDTMTVQRAQEGTTARAWALGDLAELRLTASGLAPLGIFEGASTAQLMRDRMVVPSRTGGDASGTWSISISGLAGTATALATPRAINGTNFDGSVGITTANWGTARTITIGSTGKSVNGSANVSWTLAEIGAAGTGQANTFTGAQTFRAANAVRVENAATQDAIVLAGRAGGTTSLAVTITTAALAASRTYTLPDAGAAAEFVMTAGNQTIGGTKTFSGTPRVSSSFWFDASGFTSYRLSNFNGGMYFNNGTDRWILDGSGNMTASGNVTAFSDIRLKANLTKIGDALNKVRGLTGYTYTRTDTGERQTGLVAQDVQAVLPEAVMQGDYLSVAYGNLMGLMVEAIKELSAKVETLEAR